MKLDILKEMESGYSLPSLSPVAMRLVELALEDSCSAEDLAALIETDPSLAVGVLKLANSVFFHAAQPTTSLRNAVVKVGFQRLRIMALSLSLRDTFPMGRIGSLDYEKFWHTTLYRALISKSLAAKFGKCNPEEAFAGGLIMEIGLLILFDLRIKKDAGAPLIKLEPLEELLDWERERYGLDHRQVGQAALRFWKFPETIVQCQLFYGNAALSQDAPVFARIYELSRDFSSLICQESEDFPNAFKKAEEFFGLNPDAINDTLLTTFDQVQSIADNLNVALSKDKDLMEIMEKANKALSQISGKMLDGGGTAEKAFLPSFGSLGEQKEVVEHTLQAVAHEIRNPLLAVGGFARRLAASLDPETKGGEYVKIILEEASRLEKALHEMAGEAK